MKKTTLQFFSEQDVRAALSMKEAIRGMSAAFIQLSSGRARVPMRSQITLPESENSVLFMPVYLPDTGKIAVKTVSVFPENAGENRPVIQALVTLIDAQSGQALAVMDGAALTAIRTGAASGLATDLLARADAEVLTVFGAGVQGQAQIEAVLAVRSIQKVYIVDPHEQRALKLAERIGRQFDVDASVSVRSQAVGEADIICTATTSREPVFNDSDLKEGVHINAVGAFRPDMREIPEETIGRSLFVADERNACLAEAGDLIIPMKRGLFASDKIYAEIGEIASGKTKGRISGTQITLFKSVGNAVQDLAVAEIVLQKGLKMNLGQSVQL